MLRTPVRAVAAKLVPPTEPARTICGAALVTAAGDGAWFTTWIVYLTVVRDIPVGQVSLAVTGAGVLAFVLTVPIGRLGDRLGLRRVMVAAALAQLVGMALFLLVSSVWPLFLVAAAWTCAEQATAALRDAFVSRLDVDPAHRLVMLAKERTSHQAGFAVGGLIGGVCLLTTDFGVYAALIVFNCATFAFYALRLRVFPYVRPVGPRPSAATWSVYTDWRYLVTTALIAVFALSWAMLSSGASLWIVRDTDLPESLVGVVIVVNTLGIVFFQERASAGPADGRSNATKALLAGVSLALACLGFALCVSHTVWVAYLALVLAAAGQLVGELFFIASLWGFAVLLRPDESVAGEYQAATSTAVGVVQTVSPFVFLSLVLPHGSTGWLVLGGVLAVVGAVSASAGLRASAARPVGRPHPAAAID